MSLLFKYFYIFRSSARDNALLLCDWGFDRTNALHISNVLRKLENENSYTRAASIAIFNLRMRDAIETLNKGANHQPHLSMIAMALSGDTFQYFNIKIFLCYFINCIESVIVKYCLNFYRI